MGCETLSESYRLSHNSSSFLSFETWTFTSIEPKFGCSVPDGFLLNNSYLVRYAVWGEKQGRKGLQVTEGRHRFSSVGQLCWWGQDRAAQTRLTKGGGKCLDTTQRPGEGRWSISLHCPRRWVQKPVPASKGTLSFPSANSGFLTKDSEGGTCFLFG